MRISDPVKPHGLKAVILGVLAAAIGVQSDKNRRHDFEQGSGGKFIIAGIVATLLFIFTIYMVVKLIVDQAAG